MMRSNSIYYWRRLLIMKYNQKPMMKMTAFRSLIMVSCIQEEPTKDSAFASSGRMALHLGSH
jgi:hypothetical protein